MVVQKVNFLCVFVPLWFIFYSFSPTGMDSQNLSPQRHGDFLDSHVKGGTKLLLMIHQDRAKYHLCFQVQLQDEHHRHQFRVPLICLEEQQSES